MSAKIIQSILDQVRKLTPEERVRLADEVDQLTWSDRVRVVLNSVEASSNASSGPDDPEIDRIVAEVRSEKPLYERYWIRRRRSAP